MKTIILSNLIYMLIMPFLFVGIINRVKAFWAGRKGPSLIQPFYDFMKLIKKGAVISRTTTALFYWSPLVVLTAVIGASLLTPMSGGHAIISFEGDLIVFIYLLGLAKFMSVASALETGSSFEGMGAARDAAFTSLVEPAFFIIMGTAAALSGTADFSGAGAMIKNGTPAAMLSAVLCAAALFIMVLTEGSRVPVDDPNTHLELTMIHEVMILDNSGPDLAIINYALALKMFIISSLLANFIVPAAVSPVLSGLIYAAIIILCAVTAGCVESLMARLRMSHVPQFVFFMSSISIVAFCIVFLMINGGLK
jgi:formate hydrogenlyase subunit 4